MNDVINFNSIIKHSTNIHLWYHVISATKTTKRVPKQEFDKTLKRKTTVYKDVDDYLIKYNLLMGEGKAPSPFLYNSYLSEFDTKERNFITQMIKLRNIVKDKKTKTVVLEPVLV